MLTKISEFVGGKFTAVTHSAYPGSHLSMRGSKVVSRNSKVSASILFSGFCPTFSTSLNLAFLSAIDRFADIDAKICVVAICLYVNMRLNHRFVDGGSRPAFFFGYFRSNFFFDLHSWFLR